MNGIKVKQLVAHTGFEPVISSLRGRCPKPLDECATEKQQVWRGYSGIMSHLLRPILNPNRSYYINRGTKGQDGVGVTPGANSGGGYTSSSNSPIIIDTYQVK